MPPPRGTAKSEVWSPTSKPTTAIMLYLCEREREGKKSKKKIRKKLWKKREEVRRGEKRGRM